MGGSGHGFEMLPEDLVEVIHGWGRLRRKLLHEALQRDVMADGDLVNPSWLPVFADASGKATAFFSLSRLVNEP